MIIGFIPARGGSKGIPRKNLSLVGTQTLLELGVEKLWTSGCDRVYVSTDSTEIMSKALEYGSKVVVRPEEISGDEASTESAINHFLRSENILGEEIIVLHQLTSPFIQVDSIKSCINMLSIHSEINSCFTALDRHAFTWEKQEDNTWSPVNHQRNLRLRRQELPERVIESGGVYAFRAKEFLAQATRYAKPSAIIKINYLENFEIDSREELLEANYIRERIGDSFET